MSSDNKLKKITDEATILNLLASAKESASQGYVWKLIGASKHLGQVRIEAIRKTRRDFAIVPTDGQDCFVQDLITGQSYVDLYVPDSALLLRCSIKTTDAPYRYYLQIPEFVVQADRRKSLRLNVYEASEVSVSFGKTVTAPRTMSQHFLKDCFDISTGGFSFFVSKMESKFFQTDDIISLVDMKIGNWTGKAEAQIAMIREVEPDEYNGFSYKVWRVSCRFTRIDQVSRNYLEKFIFERIKNELHAINV